MIEHNFSILNEVLIMVDKYKNITNKTCSLSVKWVLDEVGTHIFIDFLIDGKSIYPHPLNASLFELHARLQELLIAAERRENRMIDLEKLKKFIEDLIQEKHSSCLTEDMDKGEFWAYKMIQLFIKKLEEANEDDN